MIPFFHFFSPFTEYIILQKDIKSFIRFKKIVGCKYSGREFHLPFIF
nr:MAG TPA: hypothetical protein [Caudoviricetes sp.]